MALSALLVFCEPWLIGQKEEKMQAGEVFGMVLRTDLAALNEALRRGCISPTQIYDIITGRSSVELPAATGVAVQGRIFVKESPASTLPDEQVIGGFRHPTVLEWWLLAGKYCELLCVQAFSLLKGGGVFMCSIADAGEMNKFMLLVKES